MNQTEFERQLRERFNFTVPQSRSAALSPALEDMSAGDLYEMLPDYVRLTASGRSFQKCHPLAKEAWGDRRDVYQLARSAGLSTSDFAGAVGAAYGNLLLAGFSASTADIEGITYPLDAANYRPQSMNQIQLGAVPEMDVEGREPGRIGFALVEARDGVLREFSGRISFSRQIWSIHGETLARSIQTHARSVFPALERAAIALALESATVPAATGSLTVAGLSTALQVMRNQAVAGMKANLSPVALVCPPAQEITARILVAAVYSGRDAPRIVVNPWLTATDSYYLVADPRECPALLRLRLRNTIAPSIYSNVGDAGQIQFGMSYSFDIVHSGGPGVLKVATA